MVMNLSGKAKTSEMVIVICGIKYSLPCNKVLVFVTCRVTSKVLGIGSEERYWGDVCTIKSGKRSAISSDVSGKHIIFYTFFGVESARIEKYHSYKNLDDNYSSQT